MRRDYNYLKEYFCDARIKDIFNVDVYDRYKYVKDNNPIKIVGTTTKKIIILSPKPEYMDKFTEMGVPILYFAHRLKDFTNYLLQDDISSEIVENLIIYDIYANKYTGDIDWDFVQSYGYAIRNKWISNYSNHKKIGNSVINIIETTLNQLNIVDDKFIESSFKFTSVRIMWAVLEGKDEGEHITSDFLLDEVFTESEVNLYRKRPHSYF